jgi:hypothetical protein
MRRHTPLFETPLPVEESLLSLFPLDGVQASLTGLDPSFRSACLNTMLERSLHCSTTEFSIAAVCRNASLRGLRGRTMSKARR